MRPPIRCRNSNNATLPQELVMQRSQAPQARAKTAVRADLL